MIRRGFEYGMTTEVRVAHRWDTGMGMEQYTEGGMGGKIGGQEKRKRVETGGVMGTKH